jgi:hypothetical protein
VRLRSPAEYYIKGLIVSPDNYTDDAIIEMLEERGLDALQAKYIKRLRTRLSRPNPFRPYETKPKHTASYHFVMREGIFDLFIQDASMKIAFRLLEIPRVKEFVETMVLSHAPDAAIASAIVRNQRIPCTPKAIERYRHYFWNIELLDSSQMRALLNYRQESTGSEDETATKEDKAEYRAAKKASWLDSRRLAADLPYSPVTALMAQMRMGVMPTNHDLAKTMILTRQFASMRTLEATMYGGERDSHRALNFSLVAKNMGEMLESVVRPDEALRQDLERISLKTDVAPVPSIHMLSDGRHTVDVQPKESSDDGSAPVDPGSEEAVDGEFSEAEDDPTGIPGSE